MELSQSSKCEIPVVAFGSVSQDLKLSLRPLLKVGLGDTDGLRSDPMVKILVSFLSTVNASCGKYLTLIGKASPSTSHNCYRFNYTQEGLTSS